MTTGDCLAMLGELMCRDQLLSVGSSQQFLSIFIPTSSTGRVTQLGDSCVCESGVAAISASFIPTSSGNSRHQQWDNAGIHPASLDGIGLGKFSDGFRWLSRKCCAGMRGKFDVLSMRVNICSMCSIRDSGIK